MDWEVSNIVWAKDDFGLAPFMLPDNFFVSWMNGCNTKEDAIDFIEAYHSDMLILSCNVTRG